MDKRYQVFLSSTYIDLKDERRIVSESLRKLEFFVDEMEAFPATDQDQFDFVKTMIDPCDYYILIIGSRYGSTTDDGISYTEKEYDYAVEMKKHIIAFIYRNDGDDPIENKTDHDQKLRKKLDKFRQKVQKGRLTKYWSNKHQLASAVYESMTYVKKHFPSIGWIRGDEIRQEDALKEINELRRQQDELMRTADSYKKAIEEYESLKLADMDEEFVVENVTVREPHWRNSKEQVVHIKITWKELFSRIAPKLLTRKSENSMKSLIRYVFGGIVKDKYGLEGNASISPLVIDTICMQFRHLGLIEIAELQLEDGFRGFYKLTNVGEVVMRKSILVETKKNHLLQKELK